MAQHIFPMDSVNENAKQNRQREYEKATDALFMQAQRGEIAMQVWLDAVAEVKVKYPYVTEDLVIED